MIDNDKPVRFGVALTTIGRWEPLRLLLEDLASQTEPPTQVAIAHHNANETPAELLQLIHEFQGHFSIQAIYSPRGVSNGRNYSAAALDKSNWLWFANDNARVDKDFFARVQNFCTGTNTLVALQLVDSEGLRNSIPDKGTPFTRRNAWGAIEGASLFRRDEFLAVGGFDANRGSGSSAPWQAGEGTDLILRLSQRESFSISWVKEIMVEAQTEFGHLPASERRRKLRNYGRGAGNVLKTWKYPLWYKFAHLLAAILTPIRNPSKYKIPDAWALFLGRLEGLLGKPLTRNTDFQAIKR